MKVLVIARLKLPLEQIIPGNNGEKGKKVWLRNLVSLLDLRQAASLII